MVLLLSHSDLCRTPPWRQSKCQKELEMRQLLVLLVLTLSAITALAESMTVDVEKRDRAESVVVNCDAGQSLNSVISKLNKQIPNTVTVHGTCTEYVTIAGFENLTVKSTSGGTLVQPSVVPTNGLLITLLRINSSRNVTIEGLNFDSDASKPIAIGIGGGSTDVRLRNLNLTGGSAGIMIFENSQVSIARVNIRDAGWASLAIYDKSDTHVEDCLFYDDTGISWHTGIDVGTGHLTIHRTTIRNMNVGVTVTDGGAMDVNDFNAYYPLTNVSDVIIDNPTGLPSNGIVVDSGAALQVASAKLRINGSGSDSITVSNGSVLNATANLVIS